MTRILILLAGILLTAGCNDKQSQPANVKEDTTIKAALDNLSPEDRALAEQQRMCPIQQAQLGSMGTPVKVMIKDKPVFLCCEHCREKALANPDKTLQEVEELKARVGRR